MKAASREAASATADTRKLVRSPPLMCEHFHKQSQTGRIRHAKNLEVVVNQALFPMLELTKREQCQALLTQAMSIKKRNDALFDEVSQGWLGTEDKALTEQRAQTE
ncbi:hypothetical protein COO64_07470 [Pseudomonas donghuensis]|nr:hypothetical protein COO64_07470 [Pseudomonas donghuensis]